MDIKEQQCYLGMTKFTAKPIHFQIYSSQLPSTVAQVTTENENLQTWMYGEEDLCEMSKALFVSFILFWCQGS